MAYRDLINANGQINASELMSMAHRRAKAGIQGELEVKAAYPDHIVRTYTAEFAEALAYFWMWAKSLREEFPRRVVAAEPVRMLEAA